MHLKHKFEAVAAQNGYTTAGPKEFVTVILYRCVSCSKVTSEQLVGWWTLEQVRDGTTSTGVVEELIAAQRRRGTPPGLIRDGTEG